MASRAEVLAQQGEHRAAVEDLTDAIGARDTIPGLIARALLLRAVSLTQLGENRAAIADYTVAPLLPGISNEKSRHPEDHGRGCGRPGRGLRGLCKARSGDEWWAATPRVWVCAASWARCCSVTALIMKTPPRKPES